MSRFLHLFVVAALLAAPQVRSHGQEADTPQEIVITATRHESDILAIPSNVSILTREEIRRSGAQTLADLLKTKAGFTVASVSSTPHDKTLDVRGFNNGGGNGQRLLVLVDGRKTNSVTGSTTDWAQIPLENIEKIEITRGPVSALHGDTALAGVINIITAAGSETAHKSLSVEGGSFKTLRESAAASGKTKELSYSVMIQGENSDGYRDNSAYEGRNATLKLGYDLSKSATLSFKAGYHDDDRERAGALTRDEMVTYGRRGTSASGDEADIEQTNFDIGFEYRTEKTGTFSLFLSRSDDTNDSAITYGTGSVLSDDESSINQLTLKHILTFQPWRMDSTIAWGADLGSEEADASTFNDFPGWVTDQKIDYRRQMAGFFAGVEVAATSRILFSGGIRVDSASFEYDRIDTNLTFDTTEELDGTAHFESWNPHAGITLFLTGKSSLYASWARTFRYPNRDELVGFLSTALDLEPERASVWEIGLKSRDFRYLTGGVTLYTMDVKKEILAVPPAVGEFGFPGNDNIPRVRHRGMEVELNSKPIERLEFFAAYALQTTKVAHGVFDGNDMPVTPRHSGSIGGRVSPMENLDFTMTANGVGSRFMANDLSNDIPKLGKYWSLDGKASYRWDKATLFVGVANILDREYYDFGGIGGFPYGSRLAFYPAPERSFTIGAEVEF